MPRTTVGQLTYLYFLLNEVADGEADVAVSDARDAMADGETTRLVAQFVAPADIEKLDRPAIDAAFQEYYVPDETRVNVRQSGILYLMANIVEIIQVGHWEDDLGESVEVSTLSLDQ